MMEMDLQLLIWINQVAVSDGATEFFRFITNLHKLSWVKFGLLPVLLGIALWNTRGKAWRAIIVMALAVSASDILCHRVIKPIFERPRPFAGQPEHVVLRLENKPGGWSFPSNHASNMTATTLLLSWYSPAYLWLLGPYALLVMYSRAYLGVHYPSDLLGGIVFGAILFLLVRTIVRRWFPNWGPSRPRT